MRREKIRNGKITGPAYNYRALSMFFGEFEVPTSTESEADPSFMHVARECPLIGDGDFARARGIFRTAPPLP